MNVNMIVAVDAAGGIGKGGALPWPHMKEDMSSFMRLTTDGPKPAVVMGRRTWESLPPRHRPLARRMNIVVSNTITSAPGANVVDTVDAALLVASRCNVDKLWIIGGGAVYKSAFESWVPIGRVVVTQFEHRDDECDTFFPMDYLEERFHVVAATGVIEQDGYRYTIKEYAPKP